MTSSTSAVYTTTQSLPSFQLQALATVQQAQVTKRKSRLFWKEQQHSQQTIPKLLLWKSLFDQIAGCLLAASGIHPANDNNTNIYANAKQQEISLELFLKQNKNQMTDPSRVRTVLLNRRKRASSGHPSCSFSSSSSLYSQLQTMYVHPHPQQQHPRRRAVVPNKPTRQVITVRKSN